MNNYGPDWRIRMQTTSHKHPAYISYSLPYLPNNTHCGAPFAFEHKLIMLEP